MPDVDETAPDFTAPLANGDVDSFTLSEALEDGPVVLAFFPGAFTSVCSHEMSAFGDRLDAFTDAGVRVYGISVDSPFAQNAFRDELGINFDLISDDNNELIDQYDVSMDFEALGVHNVAKRAVFVVDEDGTITYRWISDDPGVEPNYDEVEEAAQSVA
jgi:peroxiredoxin